MVFGWKDNDAERTQSFVTHALAFQKYLANNQQVSSDRELDVSRASRAQEKLKKLSLDHFSELTTDVYDELQRRACGKVEHLLAVNHYHLKRNQARKKMAYLQESRFKDLVTDGLSEIKRRGFFENSQQYNEAELPGKPQQAVTAHIGIQAGTVLPTRSTLTLEATGESCSLDGKSADLKSGTDEQNSSIASSPKGSPSESNKHTQVVPYHENDTQSIDSCKQHDIEKLIEEGSKMDKTITLHEQTIESLRLELKELQKEKNLIYNLKEESLAKRYLLERELVGIKEMIKQTEKAFEKKKQELEFNCNESQVTIATLNASIKEYQEKNQLLADQMKQVQLSLDKSHTENVSLTNELMKAQQRLMLITNSKNESEETIKEEKRKFYNKMKQLEEQKNSLQDQIEVLKAKLESFKRQNMPSSKTELDLQSNESTSKLSVIKDRLQKSNSISSAPKDSSIEGLKTQVLYWQKKYQQVQTNNAHSVIDLSDIQLAELNGKYSDPKGLLSMELVTEFNKLVTGFLSTLHNTSLSADLLIEIMDKIAATADKLAKEGQSMNNGEIASVITASISHALTSTNYYVLHKETLPSLIVESAVCEIAFNICSLVSLAKIKLVDQMNSEKTMDSLDNEKSQTVDDVKAADGTTTINGNKQKAYFDKNSSSMVINNADNGDKTRNETEENKHDEQTCSNQKEENDAKSILQNFEDLESKSVDELSSNNHSLIVSSEKNEDPQGTDESKPKYLFSGVPKNNSISSLKAKFTTGTSHENFEKPKASRNFSPSGSILSRMKQLEISLNNGRPITAPQRSISGGPRPLTKEMVRRFDGQKSLSIDIGEINTLNIANTST